MLANCAVFAASACTLAPEPAELPAVRLNFFFGSNLIFDSVAIAVRRVVGGAVSNQLADRLQRGDRVRLVGPPVAGGLVSETVPQRAIYVAGGVGIVIGMGLAICKPIFTS